jgi:hypothetical protein
VHGRGWLDFTPFVALPQKIELLFVETAARIDCNCGGWGSYAKRCVGSVEPPLPFLELPFLKCGSCGSFMDTKKARHDGGICCVSCGGVAVSPTPFVAADAGRRSGDEVFGMPKEVPDPYEKFRKIARDAGKGEERLTYGGAYRELDEGKKKALFYATLALEEAFGVYKSALREYMEVLKRAVQRVEVGEEPFKKVVYMADVGRLAQLAGEEDRAFEEALGTLRRRLNEYAVRYNIRDLLDVNEEVARRLAVAEAAELSGFGDANYGVKAYAALIAYREHALGGRATFGAAAWYWLEVGGLAWLLYYAPGTAYLKAERAGVVRPVAVEELVAEALRRLFLKPGADRHRGFVEELTKGGKLALVPERRTKTSYVLRLYNVGEGSGLVDPGAELWIAEVGEGARATYNLILDVERWRGFFEPELETAEKVAEEVRERLPVEDLLLYMLGWVASDVAITRNKMGGRVLRMTTSHLWQLAETHALFNWSVVGLRMTLTLEGPKLAVIVEAPLDRLDGAVRRSAEGGWLKMLGVEAEGWDDLKRWVAEHWGIVVDAAVRRLGEEVRSELEALRDRLNDDKVAREVIAPALLLIQAERLGVNETTLRYFGAVISGAIDGDGYVSAAKGVVGLTSGEREVVLLWAATLAAHGIETKVEKAGGAFRVLASDEDAVELASLYFLYGFPLFEGDERIINHKLAEAAELGIKGLDIRWEGLRRIKGGAAADLIISVGGASVKYNVYLRGGTIAFQFQSKNRSRAELAVRLLRLAGVGVEVKKEGGRDGWRVVATTDKLVAGSEELRDVARKVIEEALTRGWIDARKAGRWLKKLEEGRVLKEGWPKYKVRLVEGALEVRFGSTDPDSIKREVQRLGKMGFEEGRHFTVKIEGSGKGYVYIRREGLAYAAWLSVHGSGKQRELAAEFVEYILQRAREKGEDVYGKALEVVEEGKARGSLTLKGLERKVEVEGRRHVVKVIGGGAEFKRGRGGRKLLRIRITAEVDGVKSDYVITYGRRGIRNEIRGYAMVRAEPDAERLAAAVETLTGKRPRMYRMKDGTIIIECGREHLDGFRRYTELADAIEKWLEKTGRRAQRPFF